MDPNTCEEMEGGGVALPRVTTVTVQGGVGCKDPTTTMKTA